MWAATQLKPIGVSEADVAIYHKRRQSGSYTGTKSGRFAPSGTDGRWADRRIPRPVTVCRELGAECVGNPEEIARLLATVTAVGKHRAIGHGEVEEWRIEPITEFTLVREGALMRCVPEAAGDALGIHPAEQPAMIGWTPPQWLPALFRPGWRAGTPVTLTA